MKARNGADAQVGGRYDVLIVGGGLVGASLACALGTSPLKVAVVEPVAPEDPGQPSYDDRSTALAPSTRRIFEALGLWSDLRPAVTPIREIHVSDRGRFGFTRMSAREERLEALGYVAGNRALGGVLNRALTSLGNCDVYRPARLAAPRVGRDSVAAWVEHRGVQQRIEARVLVIADGAASKTRDELGIPVKVRDYGQSAIVANVTPERNHNGRAYERFTDQGPLAILPIEAGRCALIWTLPPALAEELACMDKTGFLRRLQERFGYRLGRLLSVGGRSRYPLRHVEAMRWVSGRAVVIGNAAHSLHPVAGQGFNLALRDVATLAEVLHICAVEGTDPTLGGELARYESDRRSDYRRVGGFTDLLIDVFSNALPGLSGARDAGLLGLDLFPAIKRGVMRNAMGRRGPLSRLARGLPLASP